jgi:predicted oxidoreductase
MNSKELYRIGTLQTVMPHPMVLNQIELKLLVRPGILNGAVCLKKYFDSVRIP